MTWIFWVPFQGRSLLSLPKLRGGDVWPFLAGFAFSFSTSQSFLQCLLWPELRAAGAKPLEDAEVGLGLTWKCQGGVFRSFPLVFRKTWTKGRS